MWCLIIGLFIAFPRLDQFNPAVFHHALSLPTLSNTSMSRFEILRVRVYVTEHEHGYGYIWSYICYIFAISASSPQTNEMQYPRMITVSAKEIINLQLTTHHAVDSWNFLHSTVWMYKNPMNTGISTKHQLVSRFFHQLYRSPPKLTSMSTSVPKRQHVGLLIQDPSITF